MAVPQRVALVALLPMLNDWTALQLLLPRLGASLASSGRTFGILIVDDGSDQPMPETLTEGAGAAVWVRVLRLRRNVGHQRAIAIGLAHVDEHVPCDAVVVLDADGEDRPEDVPRLLDRLAREPGDPVVFAQRRRRAEGALFKAFYWLYLTVHYALTGFGVRVGNFSVVPRARVASLVVVSELWIHFAASVLRSRQPYCMVPTVRGRRLDGRSSMGFVSLVVHGLSAIAVYSDLVFTRLIMASAALAAVSLAGIAAIALARLAWPATVPEWAPLSLVFLLMVFLQTGMFVVAMTFLVLGTRQQSTIVPRRDYAHFVLEVRDL